MRRQIAVIAAVAKNHVIGRAGRIPWDLPEDRAHFRELTMGNIIVMGRRTYEEIGHPLPGRITYILSSTRWTEEENCICGGATLYQEALPLADRIYLTELSWEVAGDTYFPQIDEKIFCERDRTVINDRCSRGTVSFITYEKRNGYVE